MENATKALLIAAAVLIVIIIVALGVRLLNASGDSTKQASEASELVQGSTKTATQKTTEEIGKIRIKRGSVE